MAEFGGLVHGVAPAADHPDGNDSPHASLNLVHRDSSHPGKNLGTAGGLHLDGEEEGAAVPGGGEEPTAQHLECVNVFFIKFFSFLAFVHHHHPIICARVPHLPLHLLQQHALISDGGKKHIFQKVKT